MSRCKVQTSRHFGPIISSVFINAVFNPDTLPYARRMFDDIRDVLGDVINETEWMDRRTKDAALEKLAMSEAMLGFPMESPNLLDWQELRRMYKEVEVDAGNSSDWWTHVDDYFRLEEWHTLKRWKFELSGEPKRNVWEINAYDADSYYSRQQNQVVIPAALMQEPMFHPSLPSYINFGALGTTMATELMHGFDKTGVNFSPNGTLDPWVTGSNQERLDATLQCFMDQYDGLGVLDNKGKNLTMDAPARMDCILADTTAVDVAFKAYKRANRTDLMLPGFHRFTDDQMFFLFRSLPYCSKERNQFLPTELAQGTELPNRVRSWKPLQDSLAWHRAFGCKPKRNVCSLYGRHQTKLEFIHANPDIRTKLDWETTRAWVGYKDRMNTERKEKEKKEKEEAEKKEEREKEEAKKKAEEKKEQDKENEAKAEEAKKEEEEEAKEKAEIKKKAKEEAEKRQEAKEKAAKEAVKKAEEEEKKAKEKAEKEKEAEEKAEKEYKEEEEEKKEEELEGAADEMEEEFAEAEEEEEEEDEEVVEDENK